MGLPCFADLIKLVFFDYSPNREADNPAGHLKNFVGTLQTDCYEMYTIRSAALYPDLVHYHCLGHGRRGFEKALGNDAHLSSSPFTQPL